MRLEGEICEHCDAKLFPPRDICPHCQQEAKKKFIFSGKGTVYSYTVMQEAATKFEEYTPFVVALVKLEEGPMVTAQLTDLEISHGKKITKMDQMGGYKEELIEVDTTDFKIEIGMPVEMVTRKNSEDGDRGLIDYSYKFRPSFAMEASTSSK